LEAAGALFDAVGGLAFGVAGVELFDDLFDGFGGVDADGFGELAGGEGDVGGEEEGFDDLQEGHGVGGEFLACFFDGWFDNGRRGIGGNGRNFL